MALETSLAVHTEFFGHIAGTNGFPRILHSIENLVFHGKLLFPNRNGMQIALFQSLVKLLSEHILSQNAVEQVSWPLMPELASGLWLCCSRRGYCGQSILARDVGSGAFCHGKICRPALNILTCISHVKML